jgi:hypothetical protein
MKWLVVFFLAAVLITRLIIARINSDEAYAQKIMDDMLDESPDAVQRRWEFFKQRREEITRDVFCKN